MDNEKFKSLLSAADFFNKTARAMLTVDGRINAETLIASVARMAGSLMYRSFGLDETIPPGTSVLSEQANTQGPKLMNLLLVTLKQLGRPIGENDLNRQYLGEYLSDQDSHMSFKEALDRLAPFFLKYCEAAPIPLEDGAMGAAIACGILVHDCREVLPIESGAALAVYGFIEGAKTAPYPLPQPEQKPH